jgi:hypothetical protein
MRARCTTLLTSAVLGIVGCNDGSATDDAMFRSPEIAQDLIGTADEYAAVAADEAPASFTPAGCAIAVATGGVMTLSFDDCRGPGALRDVSGELRVIYGVGAPDCIDCQQRLLGISLSATELRANDLVLGIAGTIQVSGPRGTEFEILGQGDNLSTHSVGPCTALEDGAETIWNINGRYTNAGTPHYVSSFGYERCAGGCPVGNVYRHMSAIAEQVRDADPRIYFLGDDTAVVETDLGRGEVDARCDW